MSCGCQLAIKETYQLIDNGELRQNWGEGMMGLCPPKIWCSSNFDAPSFQNQRLQNCPQRHWLGKCVEYCILWSGRPS